MPSLLKFTIIPFYFLICCSIPAWSQITSQAPSPLPPYFLSVDFDHDGIDEIIYQANDWIIVAHRDGLSLTVLDKIYFVNAGGLQAGDLDGDGYPEIITTFYRYVYYIKNDHGSLGEIVLIEQQPFSAPDYLLTYAYDFDRDNDADLVMAKDDGRMYIIENINGEIQTDNKMEIMNTGISGGGYIKFCDYNQDGNMDILFYQVYKGTYILLNTGNWHFKSSLLSNTINPQCSDIGDFNGDGYPDIVQVYRTSNPNPDGSLEIHLNPYGALPWVYVADSLYHEDAIDIVDLDQDNVPEILLGDDKSISIFDLENGVIHRQVIWGQPDSVFGAPSTTLDAFDFDNDGKYEIRHSIYLGNSTLFETDFFQTDEEYSCDQKPNPLDCPPTDISILNQEDVDAFKLQYPNCSVLNGGLSISGPLTDLSGLKGIRHVNGSFIIHDMNMDSISSLDLAFVNGDMIVENNPNLKDYQFDQLQFINGNLLFQHLPEMSDVSGFNHLESVHSIYFNDLSQLKTITGLKSLQANDNVYFLNLPVLDSIKGLSNISFDTITFDASPVKYLRGIGNANTIRISNTSFTSLTPYGHLKPNRLVLDNISQLPSLVGLQANNTYDLTVRHCPQLAQLGMTFKINNLELIDNPVLTDLPVFTTTVVGVDHARLVQLPLLTNLNSLKSIYRFQAELKLEHNDALQDLSALTAFQFANLDTLSILANPLLQSCDIEAICGYLSLNKFALIQDNGPGCSRESEVRIACGLPTAIHSVPTSRPVSIYPNPAFDELFVNTPQVPDRLILYDLNAKNILETSFSSTISLSGVPGGLYLLEVIEANQISYHKISILK